MDDTSYDYLPIVARPRVAWPEGARAAASAKERHEAIGERRSRSTNRDLGRLRTFTAWTPGSDRSRRGRAGIKF
jgi:hypothetical protein